MQTLPLIGSKVHLGEPLPWGVRDENGKLLLAKGHIISSAAQLAELLERGAFVDVEEVKAASRQQAEEERERQRPVGLFTLWERTLWQLERLLRGIAEETGFAARCDELARHVMALTQRDADIAIYLSVRQDPKRLGIYALSHAVHCAMLGTLVAGRLAWDEARTLLFVKAALTMNIASLDVQGRLATQGRGPTPAQLETIRAHPAAGAQMLRDAGVDDTDWLAAVAQHHERRDGSGYPNGEREVHELAVALRQVDVFLAKIAPRAMRVPLSVQNAARQLFQDDGGPMASAIIKEFGIYPPGEFVQIKSGEQAVVVRRGASATTPIVSCITDRKGMPTVSSVTRDSAKPEFAITGAVADKTMVLRVPPERLYGLPE